MDKSHRIDISFAKQLEKAMKIRNVNATKLSRTSGVQRSQICRYLNSETSPTTHNIRKLSIALDVTTDFLLGMNEKI